MNIFSIDLESVFLAVYLLFSGETSADVFLLSVSRNFFTFWDTFRTASTIISLLLLTGIVYAFIRFRQVVKDEKSKSQKLGTESIREAKLKEERDERWERVLKHINSDNPNDWRQAILEADTILDEVITRAGYPGETLGEKMRGIERGDIRTIDEAWEAHKVRNRIAHDGAEFGLTRRETLRIIELYRRVFEEFEYF